MGVTKKYFHFFMAYHLAYTEDCKAKNILKFYSRSLHQRKAMPLYLTTPVLLATWDLWGAGPSISFRCQILLFHFYSLTFRMCSVFKCLVVYVCHGVFVCRSEDNLCGSQFSPSITWVPGNKLRLPGLAASAFAGGAISPALIHISKFTCKEVSK